MKSALLLFEDESELFIEVLAGQGIFRSNDYIGNNDKVLTTYEIFITEARINDELVGQD